jgi:hypothetical protein
MQTKQIERVESEVGIEGVWVQLGGKAYLIPALSLNGMRKHRGRLAMLQNGRSADEEMTDDYIDAVAQITFDAAKRNYPELAQEVVEDGIDMRNFGEVILAVMGVSGFTRAAEGDHAGAGADAAPQVTNVGESTGTA